MLKTKVIVLSAVCSALVTFSPISVLAGAHHYGSYPACQTNGCSLTDVHQHGQDTYCGHSLNDGHSYHSVCNRTDCSNQEIHEHDGSYYFGHSESYSSANSSGTVRRSSQGTHHRGHHGGHH